MIEERGQPAAAASRRQVKITPSKNLATRRSAAGLAGFGLAGRRPAGQGLAERPGNVLGHAVRQDLRALANRPWPATLAG